MRIFVLNGLLSESENVFYDKRKKEPRFFRLSSIVARLTVYSNIAVPWRLLTREIREKLSIISAT